MFRVGRVIRPQLVNIRLWEEACSRHDDDIFDDEKVIDEVVQAASPKAINLTSVKGDRFQLNLARFHRLVDDLEVIDSAKELLGWDQETNMPKNAESGKIWQLENLERMHQEKLTSKVTLYLLRYFEERPNNERLSDIDKALVSFVRQEYDREKNTPPKLSQKIKELEVRGIAILAKAREANDFNLVVSHLEQMVALKRKEAECVGYQFSPYDALIRVWEPGVTTKDLDACFAQIKKELIPIVKQFKGYTPKVNDDFLYKNYSKGKLKELCNEVLETIGFDFNSGRLDYSTDPFCTDIGKSDTRLTVDIDGPNILGLLSYVLHEGGHALMQQGIDEEIKGTLLDDAASFALDESQARLFENIIGLGKPFWIYFFPKLKKIFPAQLKDVSLDDFCKLINKVEVEPAEAGSEILYSLSVIINYEIEKDLIEGKLQVKDLPKEWNKKMREYFGFVPEAYNEAGGLLFDHHWYVGYFAYFSNYTLGDIYAAQIFESAKKDIPDLEVRIAGGNLKLLRDWLREKIHKHGNRKTTQEIIMETTGENLNPAYYINYLKNKYKALYPDVLT
ncbi:MAG: carboxypeptidase M32 [Candidatus Melainabacteria bacterium]|nr:carboxypeptidase M32 [Candidatus Melainabacteria bacterium]